MRAWSPVRAAACCTSPRAADLRHSRMAEENTAVIGSDGRCPTRSLRSSSDPPDQNASSNFSARDSSRRRRHILSRMIAQVQIEAKNNMIMTALTTQWARMNRPQIVKSPISAVPARATESTMLCSIHPAR